MKKITSIIILLVIAIIVLFLGKKFVKTDKISSKQDTMQTQTDIIKGNSSSFVKDGVTVLIEREGTGVVAENGKSVTVNYTGTFENGTVFDSSIPRGKPFDFTLGSGEVIKGWDIGVEGMKVGELRKLVIPSELAYGDAGAGGTIPPKSTLIFEVELLGVK